MNKKLLALFLACFLPVALLAGSGDANGDGKIDEKDIKLIAEYIMGKSPENFNKDEADVNNDTEIDVADIVIVSNKILEQKNQMPQFDVSSTEISVTNTQEWPGFFVYLWTSDEIRQDVDVEIEYVTPADGEWLHYEGPWGGTGYQFLYDRNYSGADRVAKIHFKNDKYNVKSSVTVTAVYSEDVIKYDYPDVMVVLLQDGTENRFNLEGTGFQISPLKIRITTTEGNSEYLMEDVNKIYFENSNK